MAASLRAGSATSIFVNASRRKATYTCASTRSSWTELTHARNVPIRHHFCSGSFSKPSQTYAYSTYNSRHHIRPVGTNAIIWTIIGCNMIVFFAWNGAAQGRSGRGTLRTLEDHMLLSWRNVQAGRYHTLLTSAFSHYSSSHLFFNMFGLWTFGGILARSGVGPLTTVVLLSGSAIAGSMSWLYEHKDSSTRSLFNTSHASASALGASGMLMGAVAAATCLAPLSPMALMGIVPMPLYVATAGFVGMDLYYLDKASRIGHSAHLGGAGFGTLFYFAYLQRFGGLSRILARYIR